MISSFSADVFATTTPRLRKDMTATHDHGRKQVFDAAFRT
jgi:hypothetical protein